MRTEKRNYSSPEMIIIALESEQMIFTGSGIGGNEELLEDPSDYVDFFE